MPNYRFKARDRSGTLHTGAIEAVRKEVVADYLSGRDLIPVRIEEERVAARSLDDYLRRLKKIESQDIVIFSRQLATLVGAGIPFLQSLATIERQIEHPRLKEVLIDIRRTVEEGASFSDALAKHPKIFSRMYVSMIRAGETAGILEDILNRLAVLAEHEAETRNRVKNAVRYPLIVVIAICGAFVFLVSFVIPKFAAIFSRFKTELPFPTRVLIGINHAFHQYWHIMILVAAVSLWAVRWYINTPAGRRWWDGLKLKLPVFGILFQKVAFSRFARIFAAMQKSGLPMMQTLDIVADTVGNVVIERAIDTMRDSLREGRGLQSPMEESRLFPPLVVQMVGVGEETGNLDTMLNKVSDYYDMDVDYTLRNLSTLIEPILLSFVAGMVLFLALGIFLPMWNMISLFKK
jgi:type II secretory pathway component PulF